jgi:hypothetical protein
MVTLDVPELVTYAVFVVVAPTITLPNETVFGFAVIVEGEGLPFEDEF